MILVTGANGFVGSYLVRSLLKQGKQVRGLRRANSDLSLLGDAANRMEWAVGDVTDMPSLQEAMVGVTHVYHVAAFISFERKDFAKLFKINAEGTANVVNAALDAGVQKLLYVSSVAALGKGRTDEVLDESEENIDGEHDTNYGLSKCLGEMEVWRGMMEGLSAVIVNPSIILGAGNWSDNALAIFPRIANGTQFYPKGMTGYVDVRDVVKAALALMDSEVVNERFIVSAENMTHKKVMDLVAENLNAPKPSFAPPKWLAVLSARQEVLTAKLIGKRPIFTPENVRSLYTDYRFDNHKLIQRLGFSYTPIANTIAETCAAYKQSIKDGKGFAILD